MSAKKLTQLLLDRRLVTEEQLTEALEAQKHDHRFFGSVLIERGWVAPDPLMEALAEYYRIPFVRLEDAPVQAEALAAVPLKVALHYHILPVTLREGALTVAITNPQDVRLLDGLRLALKERYRLEPALATHDDILQAIKKHYGVGAETIQALTTDRARGPAAAQPDAIENLEQLGDEASVMKLVNQLMLEAHHRRATDIHLEPYRNKVRLRYRVDGMLHDVDVPSAIRGLFPAIVSRIKVLSNLNIVERRLPQDGRATVRVGEEKLDLRISVLPCPTGESIVIRILPNTMLMDLHDLGFREDDQRILEAIVHKPHGLVFVTGPTGSGKTTTLYACLKTINHEERKIITLEDPIEYELEGITQVQVNPAIGLTFAQGLRSLLRHDPNVMMVGEVRDVETAELAIRIALTGHLVLSTLHTNDATSGIMRLIEMGIDPYLIVSSIECLIAQRLIRLLCPECKTPTTSPQAGGETMYQARGCKACHQTGFHGRRAIYEFFLMSPQIRELILQRASSDAIRKTAIELGMRTMREDGWEVVKQGLTTLDEVLRVTQDES